MCYTGRARADNFGQAFQDFRPPSEMISLRKQPMQYTTIFHGCKNANFQMKICDIFLDFLYRLRTSIGVDKVVLLFIIFSNLY